MSQDESSEMPRYRSHKEVHALKILEVRDNTLADQDRDGSRIIVPVDEGFAPFSVDREYVRKHAPQAGGYYVVYEDGYKSWTPAEAFEKGYTRI